MSDAGRVLAPNADELFLRVGRNLLNYQRIERMLKLLLAHGKWSGPVSRVESIREATRRRVERTTLGMLAGEFTDNFLGESVEVEPSVISEAHMSFHARIEGEAAWKAALCESLSTMVEDRNDLVHHLHSRWDSASEESTRALIAELDSRRETLRPVAEELARLTRTFADGLREHAALLGSPEVQLAMEQAWLQSSPLIQVAKDLAIEWAGPDGWVSLGVAGRVLRARLPDDVAALKERYGYSTLKRVLAASELFEFRDVPTGLGTRSEFRPHATNLIPSNRNAPGVAGGIG
jgi:hypothetical protein